jgi:hypothetical protein
VVCCKTVCFGSTTVPLYGSKHVSQQLNLGLPNLKGSNILLLEELFIMTLSTKGLRIKFCIAGILLSKGSFFRGFTLYTILNQTEELQGQNNWGILFVNYNKLKSISFVSYQDQLPSSNSFEMAAS